MLSALKIFRFRTKVVLTVLFLRGLVLTHRDEGRAMNLQGPDGPNDDEPSWSPVDWLAYEAALREEGRRYRPGNICNRPSKAEAEAGRPMVQQLDIFEDANGRSANRLNTRGACTGTQDINPVQAIIIRLDRAIRRLR
jgi:hypothetical protein